MQTLPSLNRAQFLTLLATGTATASTALTPAHAATVRGGIRALWITNTTYYGNPLADEQRLPSGVYYQHFTNGTIIWTPTEKMGAYFVKGTPGTHAYHAPSNMLRTVTRVLGPQDALVIGDSQVSDNSWVGQGIKQAGYTPFFHSHGGVGFLADQDNLFPSYHDGIVNNAYPLPLGNPGFIYIGGSGNDIWQNKPRQDVLHATRAVIRRLKEIYPNSRILLSEILSRRIASQNNRHELSEELKKVGQAEGVLVVPNRYWVTDKGAANLLAPNDEVHLSPDGHAKIAPHLSDWIRWATGQGFADVYPGMTFHNEMIWMRTSGLANGWDDGTYRPYAPVEREQAAAFFYRLAGSPHFTAPTTSPFKDVSTDHVFYQQICWMHSAGIARGWDDGTYRPKAAVEREQIAAFFYRLVKTNYTATSTPFADVPANHTFANHIAWLASTGITTGWDNGNGTRVFRPRDVVNRDQLAAFIYRYKHL